MQTFHQIRKNYTAEIITFFGKQRKLCAIGEIQQMKNQQQRGFSNWHTRCIISVRKAMTPKQQGDQMNYSAYTKIYETKTSNGTVLLSLIGEGEVSARGSVIRISDTDLESEIIPAKHATRSTHLFFRNVVTKVEYTGVLVGKRASVEIDGASCSIDMSGVMSW